jgi:hypothetical protein
MAIHTKKVPMARVIARRLDSPPGATMPDQPSKIDAIVSASR